MNWTKDQENIIQTRNCNLLVSAAAGSGKTAVLVERMIQMICDEKQPINVDELLVVTFTKAAASQMKDKIREALEKKLQIQPGSKHLQRQMVLLNQANILTIDSFCFRVVKENFHVLGVDPGIRVGESGELALLRSEVLEEVIETYYRENSDFVLFAEAFGGDKSDDNLEKYIEKMYDVSSSFPRPKEWTRQARECLLVDSEEAFMRIPYVKDYFFQMQNVVADIRIKIVELLEVARSIDGPAYMEKALLSDIGMVDGILSAKNYSQVQEEMDCKFANIGRGKAGTYDMDKADYIKGEREAYKDELKNIRKIFSVPFDKVMEQMNQQEKMLSALCDITDTFRDCFMQAKIEKNILEFSDVEHFALKVLCEGYREDGTPIPSKIGEELAEGFSEIMIDEYQDSNYLQEAILNCVSKISKGTNNIFMVGDVKQSIYRFRMARPDLFMQKYNNYEACFDAPEQKQILKNNFRSRANVLMGTNYIFYQIMGKDLGGIDYTNSEALVPSMDYPKNSEDFVEFLVGESKDFDFVRMENEETTFLSKKDENLNENLEDIGKQELEATMVARRIEELLGNTEKPAYMVYDKEIDDMRKIKYGDIVILFRAPSGYSAVFEEVLSAYGIPVQVQNEKGYLDTIETRQVLSLLRTLDNPLNEVELVASMRGYFGGMTEEELSKLVIQKRIWTKSHETYISLYKMLKKLIGKEFLTWQGEEPVLYHKCCQFIKLLEQLKKLQGYLSVSRLVDFIYYKTGYYYYVSSMPGGSTRRKNMNLLMDEIVSMEKGNTCSVFDFLTYIDRVIENAITLGGDPGMDGSEDAVRIMSIHKSKGLEFPVVFVSGMGKQYNLQDAKVPLVIHPDYHIGAKYMEPQKRYGNDTFARQCFAQLMRTENIAEELRVLYVALTRAKEKLIMTGVTSDIMSLIHKYTKLATRREQKLGFSVIQNTGSFLELVVAAFIRNNVFCEAAKKIPKRLLKSGEEMEDAEYELKKALLEPEFDLSVKFYDFRNLTIQHLKKGAEEEIERSGKLKMLEQKKGDREADIEKNLKWQYEDICATGQKSKLSVTEIKRIYEVDYDFSKEVVRKKTDDFPYQPPIPEFLKTEKKLSSSQKGTLIHKAMELLDFGKIQTKQDVSEWMKQIDEMEVLEASIRENLTVDNVYDLLCSGLGQRMRDANMQGNLYKEKQFIIGIPADRVNPNLNPETSKIVVQGIVDVYFEETDGLVLVDYKTDKVKPKDEDKLKQRYETQLRLYKDTLEQLLCKPVKETYIYSFALSKEIRVF